MAPQQSQLTSFGLYVSDRLVERHGSKDAAAKVLTRHLSRGSLSRYLNHDIWPVPGPNGQGKFHRICQLIGAEYVSHTSTSVTVAVGIERKLYTFFVREFTPERRSRTSLNQVDEHSEFERSLVLLEKAAPFVDSSERSDRFKQALIELASKMGKQHFLVVITQSEFPYLLQPRSHPDLVRAIHTAMANGAVFAAIVPSEERFGAIQRRHPHIRLPKSHAEYDKGFRQFLDGYIRHISEYYDNHDQDIELLAQLFTCDDIPIVPCGEVLALIGEGRPSGATIMRVIRRLPGGGGDGIFIAPPSNTYYIGVIAQFVESLIVASFPKATEMDACSQSLTRFLERMRRRIRGTVGETKS